MTIPIICKQCDDIVGEQEPSFFGSEFLGEYWGYCPGAGKHPEPVRTETVELLGLVRHVSIYYPETRTESSWAEYIGPRSLFLLWLAIRLSDLPKGWLFVKGKQAWADGFSCRGDGVHALLETS